MCRLLWARRTLNYNTSTPELTLRCGSSKARYQPFARAESACQPVQTLSRQVQSFLIHPAKEQPHLCTGPKSLLGCAAASFCLCIRLGLAVGPIRAPAVRPHRHVNRTHTTFISNQEVSYCPVQGGEGAQDITAPSTPLDVSQAGEGLCRIKAISSLWI